MNVFQPYTNDCIVLKKHRYDHAVWIFGTESCSEEAAYGLRHWQAGVSSRFQANPISLPQPEGRVNENQR